MNNEIISNECSLHEQNTNVTSNKSSPKNITNNTGKLNKSNTNTQRWKIEVKNRNKTGCGFRKFSKLFLMQKITRAGPALIFITE